MTIAVDMGRKATKTNKEFIGYCMTFPDFDSLRAALFFKFTSGSAFDRLISVYIYVHVSGIQLTLYQCFRRTKKTLTLYLLVSSADNLSK